MCTVLDEDISGMQLMGESSMGKNMKTAFVPSRWETVDPHEAEEQAMTTSKWEMLERENKNYNNQSMDQDSQDDELNEPRYFKYFLSTFFCLYLKNICLTYSISFLEKVQMIEELS